MPCALLHAHFHVKAGFVERFDQRLGVVVAFDYERLALGVDLVFPLTPDTLSAASPMALEQPRQQLWVRPQL